MYFNPKDSPWHLKRGCVLRKNIFEIKTHCGNAQGPHGGYVSDCCTGNLCNDHTDSFMMEKLIGSPSPVPRSVYSSPISIFVLSVAVIAIILGFVFGIKQIMRKPRCSNTRQNSNAPTISHTNGLNVNVQPFEVISLVPLVAPPNENESTVEPTNSALDPSSGRVSHPSNCHIYHAGNLRASAVSDSSVREMLNFGFSSGSGSGSGMPFLQQKTISREIEKIEKIGKGRYGEVWMAKYQGEFVAVKVFPTHEEESFKRELDFYSNLQLRHENILGLIGADITSVDSRTENWLVTEYHSMGSLYDHLKSTPMSLEEACSIIYSIAKGLRYLHSEIQGTENKPPIAHRDIKSKNILMKTPTCACIADLGLAVMKPRRDLQFGDSEQTRFKVTNVRVGTKRYMSPEVLGETIKTDEFSPYPKSDIYSFALVMWETFSRSSLDGNDPGTHQIPYEDRVLTDPSFEEMRKIVLIEGYRPIFPRHWLNNEKMKIISRVIQESWAHNPNARPEILRIEKDFNDVLQMIKRDEERAHTKTSNSNEP